VVNFDFKCPIAHGAKVHLRSPGRKKRMAASVGRRQRRAKGAQLLHAAVAKGSFFHADALLLTRLGHLH
jgi:hypothetical protein